MTGVYLRKKIQHNMRSCLASTLKTECSQPARTAQANKTTCAFLSKMIEQECDDDDDQTTLYVEEDLWDMMIVQGQQRQ